MPSRICAFSLRSLEAETVDNVIQFMSSSELTKRFRRAAKVALQIHVMDLEVVNIYIAMVIEPITRNCFRVFVYKTL